MDAAVVAVVIAETFPMWDALVRPIREHLPLWLMLLPILGAVFVGVGRLFGAEAVRRTMLVHWLLSAVLCVWMVTAYEPLKPASSQEQAALLGPLERFQFRDSFAWVGEIRGALVERVNRRGEQRLVEVPTQWGPDIRFSVGVDGISIWFVALSVLLVAIAASEEWRVGSGEPNIPHSSLPTPHSPLLWLLLQTSLVGTFIALDVVLFVVCWMSTLFSVAWLIGSGGDSQRHDAAPRILKISWLGGWLVALGLGGLVLVFSWLRPSPNPAVSRLVFSIPELVAGVRQWTVAGENAFLWGSISSWLFLLLVIGFTWPLAVAPLHRGFVESFASAPRGVAIVLAGVLLKVGIYGWLRFVIPAFPDLLSRQAESFATVVGFSSLFAAAVAFGERDWHRRVALATCSSVGLSLVGLLTQTIEGLAGGVLRMLSHGLTAGLLVWLLPRKSGEQNRSQDHIVLMPSNSPHFLVRFALFAWIGLPGLSGFVAEFVTPFGLFQHDFNAAALSLMTSGLIAWMWVRAEREPLDWSHEVWTKRDAVVAATLIAFNVALGVAPQLVLDRLQPSLVSLLPVDRESTPVLEPTRPASEAR